MNAVVSRPIVAALDGLRHDWQLAEVEALFELPFMDLLFRAQQVHRAHHAPNRVQMSTLLSIKTGGCPEDCGYCPQSIHYETGVAREDMMPLEQVVQAARNAQAASARQPQHPSPESGRMTLKLRFGGGLCGPTVPCCH
jgi:biotin synthase